MSDVGRPLTGKSLPSAAGRGAVTLTIFSDAQCPYCRSFHAIARSELERFDGRLSVRCIHFPLASHPYALGAAQALECAFDQEALDGLIDSLFAQQDRIGEKPWTAFAAEAGVADAGAFTECLKRRTFAAIDSGLRIGRDIGVTGTPTVLLNGWKFGSPPAESTLTRAIQSVLGGHQPFKGFRLGE
ncbi:MAG: DsbA family protein [Gemmatimonadales bacterium]